MKMPISLCQSQLGGKQAEEMNLKDKLDDLSGSSEDRYLHPASDFFMPQRQHKANKLDSEDVRAHIPAAARTVLGLPVSALVDMQGLSRDRVVDLLKPQRLVVV